MAEQLSQLSLFGVQETNLVWPNILTPAALQSVSQDQGGIALFTGCRAALALGHYLVAWRAMEEESIAFVDGANFFDLQLITKLSKQLQKDPRKILQRIRISRAFTVHQLEAVIGKRLDDALSKNSSRLCFISGLLDTFFDEEVPLWEAVRVLSRVMERLRVLAGQGCRVIVLAPGSPTPFLKRLGLISLIMKSADRIFFLLEDKGALILKEETKTASGKQWTLPALRLPTKRYSAR